MKTPAKVDCARPWKKKMSPITLRDRAPRSIDIPPVVEDEKTGREMFKSILFEDPSLGVGLLEAQENLHANKR